MTLIDLRSDTVTHPTPAMREAMANAPVGDDVYGDDPTVLQLELLAASMLGKEAALFVPSGNFGNQLALLTHCQRGDEVILGDDCHIVWHETGGAAVIAGVQLRTIASNDGTLDAEEVRKRIRDGEDIHWPRTGLICLENAHSNGKVIPLQNMAAVWEVAQQYQVPVHLDGARVFNAATHLGCDVRDITRYCDTVMCCLSKGLAAPVGSILAGSESFIRKARKNRKMMGGGMRQLGVLAAPGILALKEMSTRLHEDHDNACFLANALQALPGIKVDLDSVHINMVWFELPASLDTERLMSALSANGIKVNPPENKLMRLVTHWQVGRKELEKVIDTFRQVLTA